MGDSYSFRHTRDWEISCPENWQGIMDSNPRLFSFVAGCDGPWKVVASRAIVGDGLPTGDRLQIVAGKVATPPTGAVWVLQGVTSNERYVTQPEKVQLLAKQPQLGRPEADCAALIPLRKTAAWWALTQDQRRAVFEDRSRHTAIGLDYLPAVARRLHHCRDLTELEPFDFITWFEFAAKDAPQFDRLLEQLHASEEWQYVEREVEIRLIRQ